MFEPSKTAINMAAARGLKAEVVEKAGIQIFAVTDSDNKPVFQYSVKEEMLADPVQYAGWEVIHQGIPSVILDDASLREFLKNWPLLSGQSDEE